MDGRSGQHQLPVGGCRVKPLTIVVDLDGTLAMMGTRDPYDMTTVLEDEPNVPVIHAVTGMAQQGYKVIVCSGRLETARRDTMRWLYTYTSFQLEMLLLRPVSLRTQPDQELKLEMWRTMIEPFYEVMCVFDDRNKVVRMWREQAGLTCLQVAEGDF